jgi:hypothetical protein
VNCVQKYFHETAATKLLPALSLTGVAIGVEASTINHRDVGLKLGDEEDFAISGNNGCLNTGISSSCSSN